MVKVTVRLPTDMGYTDDKELRKIARHLIEVCYRYVSKGGNIHEEAAYMAFETHEVSERLGDDYGIEDGSPEFRKVMKLIRGYFQSKGV